MSTGRDQAWTRVARGLEDMRLQIASATTEEHFQAVGLLGREVLTSLGQAVFDPFVQTVPDVERVSGTDAKRMLQG